MLGGFELKKFPGLNDLDVIILKLRLSYESQS